MNKKNLWIVVIVFFISSCGIKPSSESDNVPVTATKKPISTITSETSNPSTTEIIQADAEFNQSTTSKIPPDDILNEISYYVGGGGGVCLPVYEKPLTFDFNLDIEQLHLEHLNICGWEENETINVTILNPDGKISSQTISATGEDGEIHYATVELKFRIDEPTGTYKFILEGDSGTGKVNVNVHKPNGPRLLRMDDTHLLLYGFKPLESVNLYYYYWEEFAGWQTYKVNQQGQLVIQTPPTDKLFFIDGTPIIPLCKSSQSQFFVAIGEESGEVRLPFELCEGTRDNLVTEDSIIWSCGNLKTRLLNSQRASVAFTDGSNMRIRVSPGFNEKIISSVPEGTEFYKIGTPKCVENVTWWQISVNSPTDAEGWMAEHNNKIYWIEPLPPITPMATESACNSIDAAESNNVMFIDAPKSVVQELANLDEVYVFYAHKDIGISNFNDIHEMTIFMPEKHVASEPLNIFILEGKVKVRPNWEKNPNIYVEKLLTNDYLGMMPSSVAEDFGFNQREDIMQIIFRCQP